MGLFSICQELSEAFSVLLFHVILPTSQGNRPDHPFYRCGNWGSAVVQMTQLLIKVRPRPALTHTLHSPHAEPLRSYLGLKCRGFQDGQRHFKMCSSQELHVDSLHKHLGPFGEVSYSHLEIDGVQFIFQPKLPALQAPESKPGLLQDKHPLWVLNCPRGPDAVRNLRMAQGCRQPARRVPGKPGVSGLHWKSGLRFLLENPRDISARRQDRKGWEPTRSPQPPPLPQSSCLTPVVIQINLH